ncbi:MAG: transposase [Paludibacter sp.]|nr:transposase [Paludibacter sp.]
MALHKYKQSGHIGLFDKEETGSKLSKLGNPLEKLHKVIDFEIFRIELEDNMLKHDRKSKEGDDLWNENPYKKHQKDIGARWTKKNGEKYYGYKDHAKIDTYEVTSAEVHDSQPMEKLLREENREQELHADSAYIGEPIAKVLNDKGIIPQIIEWAFKGKPLTEEQKEANRIKSKTRCRVEHAFDFVTNSLPTINRI